MGSFALLPPPPKELYLHIGGTSRSVGAKGRALLRRVHPTGARSSQLEKRTCRMGSRHTAKASLLHATALAELENEGAATEGRSSDKLFYTYDLISPDDLDEDPASPLHGHVPVTS